MSIDKTYYRNSRIIYGTVNIKIISIRKRIHYMVKEELLASQQLVELFNKYNDIKYTVEKKLSQEEK